MRHNASGSLKAVKLVRTPNQELVTHLETEVSILRQIDHPHILKAEKLIASTRNEGHRVIMPFVEGVTLANLVATRGRVDEKLAARIAYQLLKTISYLHKNGIVHRDVKPDNVLIDPAFQSITLVDFGVAYFGGWSHRRANYLGRECAKNEGEGSGSERLEMGSFTGSLEFRAPEMLMRSVYSKEVDVWATGCTIYFLLSGDLPFDGSTILRTLQKGPSGSVDLELTFDGDAWKSVSNSCKNFLKKLLRVDPLKRMKTEHGLRHPWLRRA